MGTSRRLTPLPVDAATLTSAPTSLKIHSHVREPFLRYCGAGAWAPRSSECAPDTGASGHSPPCVALSCPPASPGHLPLLLPHSLPLPSSSPEARSTSRTGGNRSVASQAMGPLLELGWEQGSPGEREPELRHKGGDSAQPLSLVHLLGKKSEEGQVLQGGSGRAGRRGALGL